MHLQGRVNIYHDAFLQKGGAESVAVQWSNFYGVSPTVIALQDQLMWSINSEPNVLLNFIKSQKQIELMYPLLPLIEKFISELYKPEEFRMVSTTGLAHHLPGNWQKRIVYMHSPTRWIWDKDSFNINRIFYERFLANILRYPFKAFDTSKIYHDDILIANSRATQKKIKDIFNRTVPVVFPPVQEFADQETKPNLLKNSEPFFLAVARNKGYKNLHHAMQVCDKIQKNLIIVGEGTSGIKSRYCVGLGRISDSELKWLYLNANALIACSNEDFGLTPIEAAFYGCPTIAYKHFGYLDSVAEGINGEYVEPNNLSALEHSTKNFDSSRFDNLIMKEFAKKFSIEFHIQSIEGLINEH